MDWHSIATVAAGVTGSFGLLGFIVYAIMFLTAKSYLTPELIRELKNANVDLSTLKDMTPAQMREWLAANTSIAREIIDKLAGPESKSQGTRVFVISIALLVIALVMGVIVAVTTPQSPATVVGPRPIPTTNKIDVQRNAGRDIIVAADGGSVQIKQIGLTVEDFIKSIDKYSKELNEAKVRCDGKTIALVKELLEHARTFARDDPPQWAKAIEKLNEAIEIKCADAELNARVLLVRGVAFAAAGGRFHFAIDDFTKVIATEGAPAITRSIALFNRGVTYGQLEPPQRDKQLADYTAVIDMRDAPAELRARALVNRGVTYAKLEPPRWDAMNADLERALRMGALPSELRDRVKAILTSGVNRNP